jgi:DNA replication protein DnaC
LGFSGVTDGGPRREAAPQAPAQLQKFKLLIVDELGYLPFAQSGGQLPLR